MNALEHALDPAMFLRIHRSIIVNIGRIKEMHSAVRQRARSRGCISLHPDCPDRREGVRGRFDDVADRGVAMTVSGGAFTPQESSIPFPEGYRRWTHVKTSLVGPSAPGFDRNGGYHHF